MMERVLVTGGAGFIGANLVRHLLATRPSLRLVTLDKLTYAGSRDNLRELPGADRHLLVEGDICDAARVDALLAEHDIDTIIHLAAESHVDRSIAAPAEFVRTNVTGTFVLLDAARRAWGDGADPDRYRFHQVSTDEVYGSLEPTAPAATEQTAYAPASPYAATKAAADHLVRAYIRTYGLPATLSHSSNNYGPYQFPEKLIPLALTRAVAGRPIPIYGDGGHLRDWLHVADHCAALTEVVTRGRVGESYHIAAGNQSTNLSLITLLCQLLDRRAPAPGGSHAAAIEHVADRPGHDRRYALASDKITAELGWRPRWSLDDGLAATADWYLDHADWIAAIRARPEYRRWMAAHYGPVAPERSTS